jgi:hypothetical protein
LLRRNENWGKKNRRQQNWCERFHPAVITADPSLPIGETASRRWMSREKLYA